MQSSFDPFWLSILCQNFDFKMKNNHKNSSYERPAYKSVDDILADPRLYLKNNAKIPIQVVEGKLLKKWQ